MLFELIQIAIGNRERLSRALSNEEWEGLYDEAVRQAVVGVAFEGVQKLPKEQWPSQALVFRWLGISEQIKQRNQLLNKRSREITALFAEAGFKSCILKGQGNALMYPNPDSRVPGDIDIWVDGTREEINRLVRERCPDVFEQGHHIEFPVFKDVEVEVHYTPGTLLSLKCNRRFQRWCNDQREDVISLQADDENSFFVPSIEFNVAYQMAHIMIHFFIEGIGLRHFVDYYYTLMKYHTDVADAERIKTLLKDFGLLRFARGVMWVEKECLRLDNDCLIVEPDEGIGSVIMKEMLEGGNFGHYDTRFKNRRKGFLVRGMIDTYRLLKLATVFPSESMWKIFRKVENQKWKIKAKTI